MTAPHPDAWSRPDQTNGCARSDTAAGRSTDEEAVLARAEAGGYAMVGPSARMWSVDLATGIPIGPVSDAEHRQVQDLIAAERLDFTDPVWLRCSDGSDEILSAVVPLGCAADGDAWLAEGDDAAHQADLDALGDDDVGPSGGVGDGEIDSSALPVPPEMLDGIKSPRTEPVRLDDPAELAAKLAELRAQIAARDEQGCEPMGGWWTVGRDDAARELAGRGVDLETGRVMVADYLRETSEQASVPVYQWGLDQGDIEAIAASHRLTDDVCDEDDHNDGAGWS